MTFNYISHQFTLFDYNAMRPKCRVPLKRISRARYDQALKELRAGKQRGMGEILSDINDALERFEKRMK
jgi:hypothetical protein